MTTSSVASGEVAVVTAILFAAAVLTSLVPPPPAFALENSALASVGPGQVVKTVHRGGYTLPLVSVGVWPVPSRAFSLFDHRGSTLTTECGDATPLRGPSSSAPLAVMLLRPADRGGSAQAPTARC